MSLSRLAVYVGTILGCLITTAAEAQSGCVNEDAIGTYRTLQVETANGARFGRLQYSRTLPLARKEVVLTFDDGPSRSGTEEILSVLDEHCVKATFFLIGIWTKHRPAMARRIARAGHTIGAHSWSHPRDLSQLTESEARAEIERGFDAVAAVIKQPVARFFRFPGLNDSPELNRYASSRGFAVMSCDIATDDWRGIDSDTIVARTLANLGKHQHRGIILFHDTKPATAAALPVLLSELKSRGYRIVHMRARSQFVQGERDAPQPGNDVTGPEVAAAFPRR